jgi:phosphate acetyltransferase
MNLEPEILENRLFDEITVGDTASLSRTLTEHDIQAFAAVSGDMNPAHLDAEYAANTPLHGVVGHGMWTSSLISTLLGTRFPGPGTIYLNQTLQFLRPVHIGDTVTVSLQVTQKITETKRVVMACKVVNQKGTAVLEGEATVLAPMTKVRRPMASVPRVQLFDPVARMTALLGLGKGLEPVRCGVVHPCDADSLRGAIEAAQQNLIVPVFIGPETKIRQAAETEGLDLSGIELIAVAHSHEAAQLASEMAGNGQFEGLMKGSLHTDELMHAVVTNKALRTKRRLSHIFRFDVPLYDRPVFISDAALNIKPDLMAKVDIVQNAIELCQILGNDHPNVAILSAVETVNPNIPSTIDAAALCKMADRGQITGGRLDGPLAFDNAVSAKAAQIKHIESSVAGRADILIVPDLESGNMLAKQLEYLAGASGSGVVLGARIPIALTSRADGADTRMASALLMKMIAHHYRKHQP